MLYHRSWWLGWLIYLPSLRQSSWHYPSSSSNGTLKIWVSPPVPEQNKPQHVHCFCNCPSLQKWYFLQHDTYIKLFWSPCAKPKYSVEIHQWSSYWYPCSLFARTSAAILLAFEPRVAIYRTITIHVFWRLAGHRSCDQLVTFILFLELRRRRTT